MKKEGERSVFRNMSRGLLYSFNRPVIGIPPFLLGTDGAVRFIPSPDFNHTVSLGKLCLYDVKRKLSLGNERYTLRGWDNGWHDLVTAVSTDSVDCKTPLLHHPCNRFSLIHKELCRCCTGDSIFANFLGVGFLGAYILI